MGGIGLLLNVAKDALLTQQFALDVVSHNIANVNTEGYTRQTPVLDAKQAEPYAGFMFGRGVELDDIARNTDDFILKRLQQRETDYMALSEKNTYMKVLEGIFNEQSERSISSRLNDFWNAWHELSNNPSGLSERNLLYENGILLSQSFQDIRQDLTMLSSELNNAMEAGIEKVNQILSQIADVNEQIISIEVRTSANDLKDQRDMLVRELSGYIDVNIFENDDGNLTVMTGRGYTLVSRAEFYQLRFDGRDIQWQKSDNAEIAITDTITGGKLGGWLDMRDEILPKFQADFDELAQSLIWETNKIHSQGVGLNGFTSMTGTYAVANSLEELGTVDSGLNFYDQISDGTFEVWLYDDTGALVGGSPTTITIDKDAGGTTLASLASALTDLDTDLGAPDVLTASVNPDNQLQITASGGYTFAFSNDTSNVLAAMGMNTFFTGKDANTITVNNLLGSQKQFIAAGQVDTNGGIAVGDNTNALDVANLQYQGVSIKRWTYERGSSPTSENLTNTTLDIYLHAFEGDIGIKSQSIEREMNYNQVILNQIKQTRDSISAVSLDEEMTNLIKYQHAYAMAAKLVSTADEMLNILLETR